MKQITYIVLSLLLLVLIGCKQRMNIQGTISVPELEDRMLYLRVFEDGDLAVLDSAQITHGKFQFTGKELDTMKMAVLFMGDESLMPIVIGEKCPLEVWITEIDQRVTGSVLNDSLYSFIRRKAVYDRQLAELPRRESQMIFDGLDHDQIVMQLNQEAAVITARSDALVMRFIKDNMDNVLAPGIFMLFTSNMPYPMLNPQIEELVTLASASFLEDDYVKEFLRMAKENMEKMNDE